MTDAQLVDLFSKPQYGGDLPYFTGKQYGSGWLKTLGRFAFPILKNIGSHVASLFGKTASDVISGKSGIKDSLKRHAVEELDDFVSEQTPANIPKRYKSINKRKKNLSSGTIFQ